MGVDARTLENKTYTCITKQIAIPLKIVNFKTSIYFHYGCIH